VIEIFLRKFDRISVLSKALQREDTCISRCAGAAKGIILKFDSKRNEQDWARTWKILKS
jgi:hypothetical protein